MTTITIDLAVVEQALEALENFARFQRMMMDGPDVSDRLLAEDYAEAGFMKMATAIPALRTALAEPDVDPCIDGSCDCCWTDKESQNKAEQEPVAWMHTNAVGHTYFRKHAQGTAFKPVPLYTAPQPRREVELTDEEIACALDAANVPELPDGYESVELEIARAVIEAYEEKNT